jgi:hypothetical protein
MRRSHRAGTLLIVGLLLVATSCYGEAETGDPCGCPNLESTASSIDWLGTGAAPDNLWSTDGFGGFRHMVDLHYEESDPVAAAERTIQRLVDAGFEAVELKYTPPSFAVFADDEWHVTVQSSEAATSDTSSIVIVRVAVTDDRRADEILGPFVDALGVLP